LRGRLENSLDSTPGAEIVQRCFCLLQRATSSNELIYLQSPPDVELSKEREVNLGPRAAVVGADDPLFRPSQAIWPELGSLAYRGQTH
jgi:hypothetical protein